MSLAFTPGFGGGSKPTVLDPQSNVPLVVFTAFDVHKAEELKKRLETVIHPVNSLPPAQKPKADDPPPTQKPGEKSAGKNRRGKLKTSQIPRTSPKILKSRPRSPCLI